MQTVSAPSFVSPRSSTRRCFGLVISREVERVALDATLVALFATLTAFGALVRIPLPFTPVPVTLQTLFVVASGIALGARLGVCSMGLYLGLGLIGLPFFAGEHSGVSALTSPTVGYLFGFLVAPAVAAAISRGSQSMSRLAAGTVAAYAVIFVFGLVGLMLTLGVSPVRAVELGLVPFLPGAVVKIGVTLAAARPLGRLRPRAS